MTGGSKVNETKKVEVCTEEGIQELKLVESIMILGNEIDKVGNGFVSMRHRLRKTEKGFWKYHIRPSSKHGQEYATLLCTGQMPGP